VFSNLLHNAFKYTPSGGNIDLTAERAGGEVVIRVRDSGIGIGAEMLPKLFEIYFQGTPSPGSELKGLGLGLTLVRQLTEMHGGTVAATSAGPGKGSEFVVRLPLAAEQGREPKPLSRSKEHAVAAVSSENPHRKVLVVEDNHDAADALALLLEAEGHDVRSVYHAASALETASQFQPEVAILDIGLPGMDGYELAQRLREAIPKIVLIALSGWRAEPGDNRVRDAGFRHYITKPVEAEQLRKLLAQI